MTQLARLLGHSLRVLYLAMSPNGEVIVTGSGDESLRFWNVFTKPPSIKVSLYKILSLSQEFIFIKPIISL